MPNDDNQDTTSESTDSFHSALGRNEGKLGTPISATEEVEEATFETAQASVPGMVIARACFDESKRAGKHGESVEDKIVQPATITVAATAHNVVAATTSQETEGGGAKVGGSLR